MNSETDNPDGLILLKPGQSIKPNVSLKQAEKLVELEFGYKVIQLKELNSYDDNNYYVEAAKLQEISRLGQEGKLPGKYVFKVLNSMDSKRTNHVEAENDCMLYLSSKGINCPIPQLNKDGKTFSVITMPAEANASSDSENNVICEHVLHAIRLLSFVDGDILASIPLTKKLLFDAGSSLANIDNLLKDFHHFGLENHNSIWQLRCVSNVRQFLYAVDNKNNAAMVESVLKEFEEKVISAYPKLDKGVIHGDYNEMNIVVQRSSTNKEEYKVHGVIDFGDMHSSYYLFEIAILLCYMMLECCKVDGLDPLDGSGHALAGYMKFRQVSNLEMKLLRTCISARLCQSLVMGAYTYSLDPGNSYLLTTASRGWTVLNKLWNETTDEQLENIWRNVFKQYS